MDQSETIDALRAENARLIALLEANGIEWRPPQPVSAQAAAKETDSVDSCQHLTRDVMCIQHLTRISVYMTGCFDTGSARGRRNE